jgi:hypothetical protein
MKKRGKETRFPSLLLPFAFLLLPFDAVSCCLHRRLPEQSNISSEVAH